MSNSIEELLRSVQADAQSDRAAITNAGTRVQRTTGALTSTSSFLVILAIIAVATIGSLPIVSLALYPFALFVTLLHESSHALAAVFTGGVVNSLSVHSDLSGVTWTGGGVGPIIDSAGYLGATTFGLALLLVPPRFARAALAVLAGIPLLALIAFHPGDLFTAVWCVVFAATLGLSAWKLPRRAAGFLQIFLGVEAGLNAFRDLMTLLFISSSSAHMQTDATNMANNLWLPPIFWAVAWTVISVALLAGALLAVVRRDAQSLRA